MKHLFSCIVLLLCLTTFTFADDCSNPLLSVFGFSSTGTPQSGSALKYCKSLKGGNSCCSASIVDSIQDRANTLAASLLGNVTQRDQALVDTRDNVIPKLQASYQRLKDAYPKFLVQLSQNNSPATLALRQIIVQSGSQEVDGDLESYKEDLTSLLGLLILPFEQVFEAVYSNLETIRDQFRSFQKARSTCAVELLKLQSSAWCLACDPAYASKGVSGTTVTMSDRVCNRLQSACYNYISYTAAQGGLLSLRKTSARIEIFTNVLEKLLLGDMSPVMSFESDVAKIPNEYIPETLQPAALPTGCTADGQCLWICSSLFKNGKVDEILAVRAGGAFTTGVSLENRVLIEEEESSVVERKLQEMRRALQSNTWDPDQDEAGIMVRFDEDPGNVNGSWSKKISLMCLISMLITLML